ncbi:hypothetical protein IRB23SM22_07060 [Alkalibacterium sp. s-m-22]
MKAKSILKAALLVTVYLIITLISVINDNPIIKYQLRCRAPNDEYTEIIETLNYSDSATFCVDNLRENGAYGFYIPVTEYIYLDDSLKQPERTIYHEYSHHLMSLYGLDKAEQYFEYVDEEHITDIIAYLLLEIRGYEVDFNDLSYVTGVDLEYLEENQAFRDYVSDVVLFEIQAES